MKIALLDIMQKIFKMATDNMTRCYQELDSYDNRPAFELQSIQQQRIDAEADRLLESWMKAEISGNPMFNIPV